MLIGGCAELGDEGVAYAPFVAALRQLLRDWPGAFGDGDGVRRRELAWLLPELAEGLSGDDSPRGAMMRPAGMERHSDALPAVTRAGEQSVRGHLFDAVLGLLEDLGSAETLLLVLEDLHWADRSTRDLLGFLSRSLRDSRVLVVGSYRTDDLHRGHPLRPFLAELDRIRGVRRIDLGPLTTGETAEQLAAIYGKTGRDLPPGFAEEVFARAEGNPFFTEELACAVTEGSNLMPSDVGGFALSDTLRDLLLIKVEQLPEPTQRMLRLLSAALPPVDHRFLLLVTGATDDELNEQIRPAFQAHILVPGEIADELPVPARAAARGRAQRAPARRALGPAPQVRRTAGGRALAGRRASCGKSSWRTTGIRRGTIRVPTTPRCARPRRRTRATRTSRNTRCWNARWTCGTRCPTRVWSTPGCSTRPRAPRIWPATRTARCP